VLCPKPGPQRTFILSCLPVAFIICIVDHFQNEPGARVSKKDNSDDKGKAKAKPKLKYESECRRVMEAHFGKPFAKVRPDFLRNPKTGRNLELDMFNADENFALEYNGAEHEYFVPYFHKSEKDLVYQKWKDALKARLCREHKPRIQLIVVPHTVPFHDLETFILKKIASLQ